jgi:hypothetical protein
MWVTYIAYSLGIIGGLVMIVIMAVVSLREREWWNKLWSKPKR